MIYVIKLKDHELYLQENGVYTPIIDDADCFFDLGDAKSNVSEDEEIIGLEGGKIQVIE